MPKYTVRFVRSARKELEALPDAAIQRIFPRIEALADNPSSGGVQEASRRPGRYVRLRAWHQT